MKRFATILLVFGLFLTTERSNAEITLSAYMDGYIAVDDVEGLYGVEGQSFGYRVPFADVNARKEQLGLNIAQLSLNVDEDKYYGTFTLHWGDLVNADWSGDFPMIQEAYIGYKFTDKFSVDGGYFTTHIGGELFLPKDNWLSSHSLVTDMEPFYHAGIRINYEIIDGLTATFLILNDLYDFQEQNDNKTFGLFVGYSKDKLSVSYANAIGNNQPGGVFQNGRNVAQIEQYHNVCLQYDFSEKFQAKAQWDMDILGPQGSNEDGDANSIMGISAQARYQITQRIASMFRFSYIMNDSDNPLTSLFPAVNGMGITLGAEYKPTTNTYIRLEGRYIGFDEGDNGQGNIFMHPDEEDPTGTALEAALNFGVNLDVFSK
jgi:hypothetical protein